MKIDILCSDGSPLGVTLATLKGDDPKQIGVGGAELALLTMCEGWFNEGHEVVLYNNPRMLGSPFEQRRVDDFGRQDRRDVLIVFRSPSQRAYGANGLRIWWSCDPYTIGDYAQFAGAVSRVVTISKFHSDYFAKHYNIRDTISIDLPVRTWEYKDGEKVHGRCLFASIPDRGLHELALCWPQIVKEIPDASLVVTSDYRLWGASSPLNERFVVELFHQKNVRCLGAVKRDELIKEQIRADLLTYPSTFEELFCISVAEASVVGAYPITSDFGALPTTNMGTVIPGDPRNPIWRTAFIEKVVQTLQDPDLPKKQAELKEKARARFSLERILNEWNERVFA